jgi:hypothetical protein
MKAAYHHAGGSPVLGSTEHLPGIMSFGKNRGAALFLLSHLVAGVDERLLDGAQLVRGDNSEEDLLFIDRKPIKHTDE